MDWFWKLLAHLTVCCWNRYEIDSFSEGGLKPENVDGELVFDDVHFSYPTRPNDPILKGLSVRVPAGKSIALVGPR